MLFDLTLTFQTPVHPVLAKAVKIVNVQRMAKLHVIVPTIAHAHHSRNVTKQMVNAKMFVQRENVLEATTKFVLWKIMENNAYVTRDLFTRRKNV
jgi:hypothetical protein